MMLAVEYPHRMILSRNPVGLSVLAKEVTGIPMSFTRNGQSVTAMLMEPHTGFGEHKWWEPDAPEMASWWFRPIQPASTPRPALLVRADGSSSRVVTDARTVKVGLSKQRNTVTSIMRVDANAHTVSYAPIAEKYPAAFPVSAVGSILVAAARADHESGGATVVYTTSGTAYETVHGDVVMCPDTAQFDHVEKRVETAIAWTQDSASEKYPATAALAVRHRVFPVEWRELEPAADALLRRYAQGLIPAGPIWNAVVTGFMTAILEDGVRTPDELHTRHAGYRDVTHHLNSGGEVDELVHALIPKWMRHPVNLSGRAPSSTAKEPAASGRLFR